MSQTFQQIIRLIEAGAVRISDHGYDELVKDGILAGEVLSGAVHGTVLEDYPAYPKGPCVLVLQADGERQAVHVVWGIPRGHVSPAVLVTAYRPDPDVWADGFRRRKP